MFIINPIKCHKILDMSIHDLFYNDIVFLFIYM